MKVMEGKGDLKIHIKPRTVSNIPKHLHRLVFIFNEL